MNQPIDKSIYRFLNSNIFEKDKSIKDLYIDDPTVMGFNFIVDINDPGSPLFTETSDFESAIQYLKNVGEPARAIQLKEFKFRLRDIVVNFPYYLQSVSGLEEFYKYNTKQTWRTAERRIKIKTLESLDLRIGNMIHKYMNAAFDETYMRERLPINLRKFNAYIVLSEIRNFKTFYETVIQKAAGDTQITVLNDHLSCYVIKLEGCRFDFGNSNPWMEEVSNANPDKPIENEFTLICDRISERHKMNMIQAYSGVLTDKDKLALDRTDEPNYRRNQWGVPSIYTIKNIEDQTATQDGKSSILDVVKSYILKIPEVQNVIANYDPRVLLGRVENLALDQIRKVAGQAILGNVFDFRQKLLGEDLISAAINRLAGNSNFNNQGTPQSVNTGGRTEYDNAVEIIDSPGHTIYNGGLGSTGSDLQTIYNGGLGTIGNGLQTTYGGLNNIGNSPNTIYPGNLGGFGSPGHLAWLSSIGALPPDGHTTYGGLPVTSVYNINPSSIKNLGTVDKEKQSDFFRAYLGNVLGVEQRPFSNLLATIVGGVIPDIIKQR